MDKLSSIYRAIPTMKIPARYDLLKQAASDRLLLNWFENAWGKTKNAILDNWESAGLIKRRKPVDEARKSAATTTGKPFWSDDTPREAADAIAKAKNKAQRELAENWDIIRQANSKTNQTILDNAKESATSTVDELSKSVKERADNLIDGTTEDIKSKIQKTRDDLTEKISK